MLGGRVKTLHPSVHGGILAKRDDPAHLAALAAHNIGPIDLVVCNLYPFAATAASGAPFASVVEQIDVGGPSMIRAAAKNHASVAVVVEPGDYADLLASLGAEDGGRASGAALRRRLAWKAFATCAAYDAVVAEWMWAHGGGAGGDGGDAAAAAPLFPPLLTVPLRLASPLRYGENPHQAAAFYASASLASAAAPFGVGCAVQHHGKEMSYNNYLDADAAFAAACDLPSPGCVVVKHTNPCGAAVRDDLAEAYRLAVRCDPISAFGGIVAFNRPVDEALAREIREFRSPGDASGATRMFYEIVIAPGYTPEGLAVLKGKSEALRILEAVPPPRRGGKGPRPVALRSVGGGGVLAQQADDLDADDVPFAVASKVQPTPSQLADLKLAWRLVKHVKSNAIVLVRGGAMLGAGAGQPNRVGSVDIALARAAGQDGGAAGAAMASDAFFPFAWGDSVERACAAGVAAIAHPGGSKRDADALAVCDQYGVALCVTGVRHFRH